MNSKPRHICQPFEKVRPSISIGCRPGFALIATISVMTLLVMIALAMLSLSAIESRASNNDRAQMDAQANARMALMIAIGELQKSAGPDQRITATADILDAGSTTSTRSRLTGVWRSWENLNNYLTSPPQKGYDTEKEERFLQWLVSTTTPTDYGLDLSSSSNDTIHLAGTPGGTEDGAELRAEIQPLLTNGAYAWLVMDEGVKANYSIPNESAPETALTDVENFSRVAAASRFALEAWGKPFDTIKAESPLLPKSVTTSQLQIMDPTLERPDLDAHFHALTPYSKGLLVDVNRGGFKHDLSLAMEANSFPSAITTDFNFAKPLYELPWPLLRDYCRQYKSLQYTSRGKYVSAEPVVGPLVHVSGRNSSKIRRYPVVARIQTVVSYYARPKANEPAVNEVGILFTPVITLWNPYNLELRINRNLSYALAALPYALRLSVNGVDAEERHFSELVKGSVNVQDGGEANTYRMNIQDANGLIFKPGESLVFSPASNSVVTGGKSITMAKGFRRGGGTFYSREFTPEFTNGQRGVPITATAGAQLSLSIEPNNNIDNFQDWAVVYHVDASTELPRINAVGDTLTRFLESIGHSDTPNVSASQALNQPIVCASMSVQLQTATDTSIPSLGYSQTNPVVARSEYGRVGATLSGSKWRSKGIHAQPMAQAWIDINAYGHSDWDDTYLPQADQDDHGFVSSGIRADSGVSFSQVIELPVRPLQSLAALQHFDISVNHLHCHPFYQIGNAVASPTIPPNDVVGGLKPDDIESGRKQLSNGYTMYQDFQYMANALLFDRYFFSSIAPRSDTFSSSPAESISKVYGQHLDGTKALPNNRFLATTDASDKDVDTPSTDYATVASKMMIHGAFNVNSTSVEAWKAFLGSLNNERVPYRDITSSSNTLKYGTSSGDYTYVISRFNLPGGGSADADSPSADAIPEELFWRGYRRLTQDQIELLAEKIVEQVRTRGPFLSFGEFVNRRLEGGTSENELARRGTLQAALEHPDVDINRPLEDTSQEIELDTVKDFEDYVFPEAATGHTAFAAPGWVTQADILRPLAPYMTVRSDTFRVRAYGESKNAQGQVLARAWCEAVVQRFPEYVDPSAVENSDASDGNTATESPYQVNGNDNPAFSKTNREFGRRFRVVSFQWLNEKEL